MSHLYFFGVAGLAEPQLAQNLPVFLAPQEQIHSLLVLAGAAPSLLEPQLAQNLPVLRAPQEQTHASGFFAPQDEQNAPVFVAPQLHFHALGSATGAAGCPLGI